MTRQYSFARAHAELTRAASAGTTAAAEALARELRANGEHAIVQSGRNGSASVIVEGAAVLAREFGTKLVSPRPIIGPAI